MTLQLPMFETRTAPAVIALDRLIDQAAAEIGKPTQQDIDRAKRFRGFIATTEREIKDLRASRLENTPKRQREGMDRRIRAANAERLLAALVAMAEAIEAGTLPGNFRTITSRTALHNMTAKRIESTSYYSVSESDKYIDESPLAVELRAWVKNQKTPAQIEAEKAQASRDRIKQLEESIRFVDIPGFFPTPPALVSEMLRLAEIQPGMSVLEPSAGKGDIADAIKAAGCDPLCYEINHSLGEILKAKGLKLALFDFLKVPDSSPLVYDRVLMNPPFENGQDMAHVRHAFGFLKPGGRLVAIISASPIFRENKASTDFRAWLEGLDFSLTENPDGSFVGAFKSTGVKTFTLVINKAA